MKGQPISMIPSKDANADLDKAPSNGTYVGADGLPHFVRKGDPIPEGYRFVGEGGNVAAVAADIASAADQPAPTDVQGAGVEETGGVPKTAKAGKRGPTDTTDAAGPTETT